MAKPVVSVQNVHKSFSLPKERKTSLREHMFNPGQSARERVVAVNNVTFEVKQGEFFGIIGNNGSGKSTLLKMLAGVYSPDSGQIQCDGPLSPFLELGVGFHPELSGFDNVYVNGALLGLSKKEIDHRLDDIIAFSELEEFMGQKLKNYSSGMQVRLAFSVAIHADKEILLMDEVLAVGDMHFQGKCLEHFQNIKDQGKTVIFVSHDLGAIQRHCDRVLYMENGKAMFVGAPDEACSMYMLRNHEHSSTPQGEQPTLPQKERVATIESLALLDTEGKETDIVNTGDTITFRVRYELEKNTSPVNIGIGMYSAEHEYLFSYNTQIDEISIQGNIVELCLPNLPLLKGNYYINVVCFGDVEQQFFDFKAKALRFTVISTGKQYLLRGRLSLPRTWKHYDD